MAIVSYKWKVKSPAPEANQKTEPQARTGARRGKNGFRTPTGQQISHTVYRPNRWKNFETSTRPQDLVDSSASDEASRDEAGRVESSSRRCSSSSDEAVCANTRDGKVCWANLVDDNWKASRLSWADLSDDLLESLPKDCLATDTETVSTEAPSPFSCAELSPSAFGAEYSSSEATDTGEVEQLQESASWNEELVRKSSWGEPQSTWADQSVFAYDPPLMLPDAAFEMPANTTGFADICDLSNYAFQFQHMREAGDMSSWYTPAFHPSPVAMAGGDKQPNTCDPTWMQTNQSDNDAGTPLQKALTRARAAAYAHQTSVSQSPTCFAASWWTSSQEEDFRPAHLNACSRALAVAEQHRQTKKGATRT